MTAPRPLLFGKLPRHGDFVSRGLDDAARTRLDLWLSEAIEEARSRLGPSFEPAHDGAPVWRFMSGRLEWGAPWTAGALAPSMDSAGRRFFIVVGAQGISDADVSSVGPQVAQAAEDLIYAAFAGLWGADDLLEATARQMAGIPREDSPAAEQIGEAWWVVDADGHTAYRTSQRPQHLVEEVQADVMGTALEGTP